MLGQKKYNSFHVIKIPFYISPILMIVYSCVVVLMSVLPTSVLALITAQFITIVHDIFNGQQAIHAIYIPFMVLLFVIGLSSLLNPILSLVETRISLKLEEVLLPELIKKQAQLPYQYIEHAESWELIDRINSEMTQTFIEGLQGYTTIAQSVLSIMSVAGILLYYAWWAAVILIVTSIPLYVMSMYWGKKHYEAKVNTYQYERRYSYYSDDVLMSRQAVEERTLFSYTDSMTKKYEENFIKARDIQLHVLLKSYISMKGTTILFIIVNFLTLLPLIDALVHQRISSGTFIGIAIALFAMVDHLGGHIQQAIKHISESQEYMHELTYLMSLPNVEGSIDIPKVQEDFIFESLEFIDVWFKYPNADEYILKGMSFQIISGKHYAFVGLNGAGKTTITKLLTGLYLSYEGQILINGKELKDYSQANIKAMFSVVYQDFAKYHLSLKDNICLGNLGHACDIEKIERSLEQSELNVLLTDLPNGIETHLGRLSNHSYELSGGQWQKIAIARSIYSNAPINILDEPTASLDPLAESKLYDTFGRLMEGKTSLLITHRLGATRLVNDIFVIDAGKVVERGNHHTLMALNGYYAQMYKTQKEWYHD
ncbi:MULTISPECIES: ABC transporter ATP-binding protein [unclassified Granulicatella]|uniref:ABC transporter ATP-binding protein n=1 Tax=unclassified Granulicatella TaxID=2630493 RepID=UPI00107333F3|nr:MULTISPECIES: ABC transporter ATP-binding protein [unclassified Granulicatella]MBF0780649.1 ABC transporter ATP-binding protein [Granulicatella sp. 19428wC4_WM01]TFU94550.1 ABC transporter ATP-binding protein [Granulicatella sp. WM01]